MRFKAIKKLISPSADSLWSQLVIFSSAEMLMVYTKKKRGDDKLNIEITPTTLAFGFMFLSELKLKARHNKWNESRRAG